MSEPIISRNAVREGELAFANRKAWLDGDIWHIPSVRDVERWESTHTEAAVAALSELMTVTTYRDDTGLPETPYTKGFRDACEYIARSIFGDEPVGEPLTCCVWHPVPGMDQPYPAVEPDLDSRDEYEREAAPLLQEDRR